jgi:hypothetical protein
VGHFFFGATPPSQGKGGQTQKGRHRVNRKVEHGGRRIHPGPDQSGDRLACPVTGSRGSLASV